jgi:Lon protease-like protein
MCITFIEALHLRIDMTNFIPIFPLGIVAYPGEKLNLHIFEPRYKQLITDCYAESKPFGIPTVLKKEVGEWGTLMEIKEIVAVYPDGKMDIRIEGLSIFRILEVIKNIPDKLFGGAIVSYPENHQRRNILIAKKVVSLLHELHHLLNVTKDFKKPDEELTSYDIAHHTGLSLEEEYELLGLLYETQRLEYLKRHLNKIIPIVAGTENLKEKIQLNGHFRELKGFNFDL